MQKFSLTGFVPASIGEKYAPSKRKHQGIPGVEVLSSGRLFAVYYTGELAGEGPGNYVVLATSTDCGRSWKEIQVVAPESEDERAYDSVLWLDPAGRLWWGWCQSYSPNPGNIFDGRAGVWVSVCDAPDTDSPVWSAPRRIAEGIMMNKPTVFSDGTWAFPAALWRVWPEKILPEYADISCSCLTLSRDEGKTFELAVGPVVPDVCFDEHMVVERRDGSWLLLVRTHHGISQSFSSDHGKSWSVPEESGLGGPNSRFAIRRLKSGRLLLVNHQVVQLLPGEKRKHWGAEREKLTAWLSDDDGASWYGRMMIDERPGVSYPDVAEGEDGFIYCIYDHNRCEHGQILLSRFSEADVAAGAAVTPGGFGRNLVSAF